MNLKLKNKKVFICSADTDLGAACVAEYLKQGSKINATCLSAKKLKRLLKRFGADENDKNLNILINDISSEKDRLIVKKSVQLTDILITHVPGPPSGDFLKWTNEDWLKSFNDIFLTSAQLINFALPRMRDKRSGSIINISSMTTNFPMHNLELSTVSRTALEGFTKSIAKKNDFPGININSILPGYFLTESLENFIKSNPEPDQENIKLKLLEKIPVGRFGKPEDFAKLCCFLSSEYGRFISGQSILINGGQVA